MNDKKIGKNNIYKELHDLIEKEGIRTAEEMRQRIIKCGLELSDKRLSTAIENLNKMKKNEKVSSSEMVELIAENGHLLSNALCGNLVVSEWDEFCKGIEKIFEETKSFRSGNKASYIPALSEVNSELYAVSVCTVDGQRLDIGDINHKFCVQSCSKAITYLVALSQKGTDYVHRYVGREPSGLSFNSLTLKKVTSTSSAPKYMPHNPMINAGAIMCCSIIRDKMKTKEKCIECISDYYTKLCGGDKKIEYSKYVFESELKSADRNRCLAYMMREYKSFPNNDEDVEKVLEFYFKTCALEFTPKNASVMAASLANGGVCPLTNEAIFKPLHVRNCLSQMLSCGMYDYSGEWAFSIGLPAKSGVSGCILIVIPEKMGIAVYSPRLDTMGNSVRGVAFAERLVRRFSIHRLDSLRAKGVIKPVTRVETSKPRQHKLHISGLLLAAASGDLDEIRRLVSIGLNPFVAGVDGRTALHLAASENRVNVIDLMLEIAEKKKLKKKEVILKDNFGSTALDDAERGNKLAALDRLRQYMNNNNK